MCAQTTSFNCTNNKKPHTSPCTHTHHPSPPPLQDLKKAQTSIQDALTSSHVLAERLSTVMPVHLKRPAAHFHTPGPVISPRSTTPDTRPPPLKKRAVSPVHEDERWLPTVHNDWLTRTKVIFTPFCDCVAICLRLLCQCPPPRFRESSRCQIKSNPPFLFFVSISATCHCERRDNTQTCIASTRHGCE